MIIKYTTFHIACCMYFNIQWLINHRFPLIGASKKHTATATKAGESHMASQIPCKTSQINLAGE
jgi:hypothetical protein